MTKIKINAHITNFHVVADRGDGKLTILAEHRRYDDALAAAHLIARDMGLEVEAQLDAKAALDDQTADALITVRHHQTTLLTMVDDEVAEVFGPKLNDALNVIQAALKGISVNELTDPSIPPWQRTSGGGR